MEGFSDLYAGFKLNFTDPDGLVPRLPIRGHLDRRHLQPGISNRDVEPTIKLIGSWDLASGFALTSNAAAP